MKERVVMSNEVSVIAEMLLNTTNKLLVAGNDLKDIGAKTMNGRNDSFVIRPS